MSISAINWAFHQKTGSPASKLVLIKLADNTNDEGYCWPSIRKIARYCEMHRRTVERHITDLAAAGFLSVENRFKEGVQLPNNYIMHLGFTRPLDDEIADGSGRMPQPPRHVAATPPARCRNPPGTLPHRIVIEPSVKPSVNLIDTHQPKSAVDARAIADSDAFNAFWSAYPRKKNRAAAVKAFRRIKPELLPTLFADIEARIRVGDWRLDQPEFIPHPATYLNGERWTDVITPRSKNDETSRHIDRPRSPGERFAALRAAQQAEARGNGQTLDGDAEHLRPPVREQFRAPAVGRLGNDFGRDNPKDDRGGYRADEDD